MEVAVTQQMNKAATGDQKALSLLLPLVQIIEGRAETDAASTPILAEADELVMANIRARLLQNTHHETANQPQQIQFIKTGTEDES